MRYNYNIDFIESLIFFGYVDDARKLKVCMMMAELLLTASRNTKYYQKLVDTNEYI